MLNLNTVLFGSAERTSNSSEQQLELDSGSDFGLRFPSAISFGPLLEPELEPALEHEPASCLAPVLWPGLQPAPVLPSEPEPALLL